MGVTGEHEIDRAGAENLVALLAGGMGHGHDEVGPIAAQRLRLFGHGRDRRQKPQVARIGRAGAVVEGRAGEADAHAVDGHDGTVLELRQRLPVGATQVGGIEREVRLRHALQEDRLAEIEFVVAGHENIRRDEIAERDDVGAAVDAGHQRG